MVSIVSGTGGLDQIWSQDGSYLAQAFVAALALSGVYLFVEWL